jgi:hypothetical protein
MTLGEQEFSNAWSNGQGERGAGHKSGSIVQERKQGEGARGREHNTRRGAGNNRREHGARGEVRL